MPPEKKPKPEPVKSKTRERVETARAAVKTSKGEGGPVVATGVYFKKRHEQNKARRGRQREATERARVRGEQQRQEQKAERRARPFSQSLRSLPKPRRLLLAELILCLVVIWGGVLVAPKGSNNGTTRGMVKTSGMAATFLILALIGATGKGAEKAAAAFGGLVTLAYVCTSQDSVDLFKWAAGFFSKKGLAPPAAEDQEPAAPPSSARPTLAQAASV